MANELKCGLVSLTDGKSRPQPVKLQLSPDSLTILKEELVPLRSPEEENADTIKCVREVVIHREKNAGLGLSLKGGAENILPVLISKILPDHPAHDTGKLMVGDAILKINGICCEKAGHDEVVHLLKNAGTTVCLTVKFMKQAAFFLTKGIELKNAPEIRVDSLAENRSCPSREMSNTEASEGTSLSSLPHFERQWSVHLSVPLLFAFLTRYCQGTDQLRTNAFEVVGLDGVSTGVLHCDDAHSLADWMRAITHNIQSLISQNIRINNRLLLPEEHINYMNWLQERVCPSRHWQAWKPKFIALKAGSVYFFDMPPMQTREWIRCDTVFSLMECMLKVLKDNEILDYRQHSCTIQTGTGEKFYLSAESRADLLHLEKAWHQANHAAVIRLKSRTFGCSWRGRVCGFTLDLNAGFSLYDNETKSFMWSYKFSRLKGSSDDGKTKLKLSFSSEDINQIEHRELECTNLHTLLYCIHSFLSAKLASVDPAFLNTGNY